MASRRAGTALLAAAAAAQRSWIASGAASGALPVGLLLAGGGGASRAGGIAPAALAAARSLATSAGAASAGLAEILREELVHEKDNYQRPEAVAAGPPAPFVLESAPGDTLLTLRRRYNGEEVVIDCSVNMQARARARAAAAAIAAAARAGGIAREGGPKWLLRRPPATATRGGPAPAPRLPRRAPPRLSLS